MGRNHIDARLGAQCNYGVLGLFWVPHLGPTPGAGVWPWDPYSLGSRFMGYPMYWDPGTRDDAS